MVIKDRELWKKVWMKYRAMTYNRTNKGILLKK